MNKLIISILLMVGLVGMIGTASAGTISIESTNPILLDVGEYVELDVTVSNLPEDSTPCTMELFTINITCHDGPLTCNPSDIDAQIITSSYTAAGDPHTEPNAISLERSATPADPDGTKYIITLTGTGDSETQHDVTTRTIKGIPEFPTVALPIAAVLGLMFIISSRKKKE